MFSGSRGIHAADNRDAACLELGKGVSDAPEIPGFEVRKTGVLLGHGIAARAAAALHVELALGCRVMRSVRHVAEHGDGRPAVQPPGIIG